MARKRRKLPNGIGSITKLGKTKAGKNRLSPYMARLPAYYDIEGKEIRKVIGCFRTYTEAQEALLNYNGLDNKADKLIDIYNAYKQSKDFRDLTRKTQVKYDTAFSHFEQLHTQKIININRYQLQKVIDNKVEEGYYTLENGEKKNWFWRNVYSQPSVLEISNVAAPDSKSHVASMVLLVLDSTTKPCV